MNFLTSEKFSFQSKAVADDTFGVIKFSGTDGLSQLYHFDILLVADDPDIDMDAVLQDQATFFIHRSDGSKIPFHGILAEFDIVSEAGGFYLYRALLVPKLWRLTLTNHNQIFLGKNPEEIISAVLEDGGLNSLDYGFRLQGSYQTWDYVCQYGESHYDFIARWMERSGMYYFFDQLGDTEKLVITDTKMAHAASVHGADMTYSPVSGLEAFHLDEAVQSFACRRKTVPNKVLLKDYNYRKPSLEVSGQALVAKKSQGEMYFYGDHFRSPEEGNRLAQIRAEELLCKAVQFHGSSTVPYLRPGYTIQLGNHFRQDMNRGYLTIAINHYGNQASALISGLREQLAGIEQESVYRNTFTTIGDDVQFRTERHTDRPRLSGTISAKIDAAGSGKYAEVDDQGRYKVILPFDLSGRSGGKASAWFRMMQPYGGADHGMHFPLHKGTEVLLTFIDGDPDRPIITGAVANPDNPSQINSDNQTMAKLTTAGGNKLHIEDKEGSERILMQTPGADTYVRIGMPNDPDDPSPPGPGGDPDPPDPSEDDKKKDEKAAKKKFDHQFHEATEDEQGYKIATAGWFVGKFGAGKLEFIGPLKQEICWGNVFETVMGLEEKIVLGNAFDFVFGGLEEIHIPNKLTFSTAENHLKGEVTKLAGETTKMVGEVTKMVGENTKMIGSTTKMIGSHEKMIGQVVEVVADANTARGQEAIACAQRMKVVGDDIKTAGSVISARGEDTVTAGESIELVGSKTKTVGSKLETAGESTRMAGEETLMSAEASEVVGFKSII